MSDQRGQMQEGGRKPAPDPSLTVVLPTLNEASSIVAFIASLASELTQAEIAHEIRVMDDDSADGTAGLVTAAFGTSVSVTVREPPHGLALSFLQGIREAKGEYVVLMASDFNHKPTDVARLMDEITQADLVIGSRFVAGGGMPHALARAQLSRAFNLFVRLMLRLPSRENLSGFICMRRDLMLTLPLSDIFTGYGDSCIRLLHAAHRYGLRIREVPVQYGVRAGGASNTRIVHHGIRYAKVVFALWSEDRRADRPPR